VGLKNYSWEYNNPVVWGTDARNARLYMRNPSDELHESVLAVRRHFMILAQGSLGKDLDARIDAHRISNEALSFLPVQFRTFSSSSYFGDVNLVLRGEQPRNGLAAMLTALEKAALKRASE